MFALHRRTAWGSAAIEASAWDFSLSGLQYCGQITLAVSTGSFIRPSLFQFIDDGSALIYAPGGSVCVYKYPLSTPYDILTADLTVIPTTAYQVTDYSSGLIHLLSSAQFSQDGRHIYMFQNLQTDNFMRLDLDIPFYPFSKKDADRISITPSVYVTGSSFAQFSSDGLNFYVFPVDSNRAELQHYTLNEPFDVTTLSLAVRSVALKNIPRTDSSGSGFSSFSFSPDGLRLLTVGGTFSNNLGSRLRMWSLQQPWDITRISHIDTVSLNSQEAGALSRVDVSPDASFLYVYSNVENSHKIVQYAIPQT